VISKLTVNQFQDKILGTKEMMKIRVELFLHKKTLNFITLLTSVNNLTNNLLFFYKDDSPQNSIDLNQLIQTGSEMDKD
jgi:hypothetical protein